MQAKTSVGPPTSVPSYLTTLFWFGWSAGWLFWERVSLCSPGWELTEIWLPCLPSAGVFNLLACTAMPGSNQVLDTQHITHRMTISMTVRKVPCKIHCHVQHIVWGARFGNCLGEGHNGDFHRLRLKGLWTSQVYNSKGIPQRLSPWMNRLMWIPQSLGVWRTMIFVCRVCGDTWET